MKFNMELPVFVMLVGLPGSGKTFLAESMAKKWNASVFSSDKIREEVCGDVNDQTQNQLVFQTLHRKVKESLKDGNCTVYDATNVSSKRRKAFLDELKNIPCCKLCVVIATPYSQCVNRSLNRDRVVPESVISKMRKKWDAPASFEGWDLIAYYYDNDLKQKTISSFIDSHQNFNQDNSHHSLSLSNHLSLCEEYLKLVCNLRFSEIMNDNKKFSSICEAALLHDCGKPLTKSFVNYKGETTNEAHYYKHDNVGAYESMFYETNGDVIDRAVLINLHMYPYYWESIKDEKIRRKTIGKYHKLWGDELFKEVVLLHEADVQAH